VFDIIAARCNHEVLVTKHSNTLNFVHRFY